MITFPTAIQNKLNTKTGTQPILILEVDWTDTATVAYSDADYPDAYSRLISVGTIDRSRQSQISNQISVVLDSTDDIVESIFRNNDIHLRPVRLYLGYEDITDKALLFDGLINSNIVWDESGRSLQFEVLSKLEDGLVGFAMEDGNFPVVSQDDRGKNWPLPFGTNCHYQAQRLTTTIKGFLLEGHGAADPTLPNRICQIEKATCPLITRPVLKAGSTPNSAITSEDVPDPSCLARKRNEGCILKDLLSKQQALSPSSFTVKGGANFPQNQSIKIRVGAMSYIGVMVGETFTIHKSFHPDADKVALCKNVRNPRLSYRYGIGSEEEANTCSDQGSNLNNAPVSGVDCITGKSFGVGGNFVSTCGFNAGGSTLQQIVAGGSKDSWDYYDQMQTGQFIWAPPGTDVILQEYDDDLVYMASLVPGTVTEVVAYRQFGDQKLLSQIPTDWYTVQNVDYGGYQCVELRFNTLPSSSDQPGWEDDIYVSFVSSVGPSPVDIIEWLVDTYTDLSVDSTNFAAVKSTLTEFHSNFVVQDRPSVLSLIQDIARQQRMGVRINNGVVSLVYLATEPTSQRTLTLADLVQNSFQINYTETEDLVTNQQITWKEQYTSNIQGKDVEKELALRYNIPKYGTNTAETNWYTQNTFETVLKTTTFWLIRESNTWQEVEFQTGLEHLDLDILDSVTLNISQFPSNTKVVLTDKQYDTNSNTIRWKAWTPIRAGESSPYQWAWPATVTNGIWPPPGDDQDQIGNGSGLTVVPPADHPLRVGYVGGESIPVSTGDAFPSDVGFVATTVSCEVPLGSEVVFAQTPVIDPLAKQVFNNDLENKQNGNAGGASISYEKEDRPCDTGLGFLNCPFDVGDPPEEEPEEGDCKYYVKLTYIIPNLIRENKCGGPCKGDVLTTGASCNATSLVVTTEVSSYEAAEAAVSSHNQEWQNLTSNCGYQLGVIAAGPGANINSYDSENRLWVNIKPANCSEEHSARPNESLSNPTTDGDPGENNLPSPSF